MRKKTIVYENMNKNCNFFFELKDKSQNTKKEIII